MEHYLLMHKRTTNVYNIHTHTKTHTHTHTHTHSHSYLVFLIFNQIIIIPVRISCKVAARQFFFCSVFCINHRKPDWLIK